MVSADRKIQSHIELQRYCTKAGAVFAPASFWQKLKTFPRKEVWVSAPAFYTLHVFCCRNSGQQKDGPFPQKTFPEETKARHSFRNYIFLRKSYLQKNHYVFRNKIFLCVRKGACACQKREKKIKGQF